MPGGLSLERGDASPRAVMCRRSPRRGCGRTKDAIAHGANSQSGQFSIGEMRPLQGLAAALSVSVVALEPIYHRSRVQLKSSAASRRDPPACNAPITRNVLSMFGGGPGSAPA